MIDSNLTGIIGAAISIITLAILVAGGIFTLEHRLTRLETQMEPFGQALTHLVVNALMSFKPTGNPISNERWQALLLKLNNNSLTLAEAQELNDALLEQQVEAQKAQDSTKVLAIVLGLLLVAAILKKQRGESFK